MLFVAGARESAAGVLTVRWDPSPDSAAEGYVVFVGTTSRAYTQTFYVGNQLSFDFHGAAEGQRYYFAVASYAPGAIVGPLSPEVTGAVGSTLSLANPGDQITVVSQASELQLFGGDSSGRGVTFGAFGLPQGLAADTTTGRISGTAGTAGSFAVTATVSNGLSQVAEAFVWTVEGSDKTSPIVRITSPSATSHVTSYSYAVIAGTATAARGVVAVTWKTNRGEEGRASGNSVWTAAIPLHPGNNFVTVTAVDADSNSGAAQTVVLLQGQ